MFYSNEDVAKLVNVIYAESQDKESLPSFERVIGKLDNREGFALKYYVNEITRLPIEYNGITEMIPHFNLNVKLLCLFPFGADLWTDDRSIRIIKDAGIEIDQESLTVVMNQRFEMYSFSHMAEAKTHEELFISFVKTLNIK